MPLPTFPVRPIPSSIIRITDFAGLNLSTTSTQIADNESPDMINITLDTQGQPDKRLGYSRLFTTTLGASPILGMYEFVKQDGTIIFLIHHSTNLYTQTGTAQPVSIYSSMANAPSKFITFNNKCYILDGTNYLQYDGTTVVDVSTIAYVPTIYISTPPTGGGTVNENMNLLTPTFKQSFSGNNAALTFQLAFSNLDASPPMSALVNNVVINEGSGMTVNRATGLVTFTVAPTTAPNNVVITAYKTQAGNPNRIKQCRDFAIYGGTNDTRVFFYGNPNFPNYLNRSGLYDPTYAPDLAFQKIGNDANSIQKVIVQYDSAIILKSYQPNDTTIWQMSYATDSQGIALFPVKPLNSQIGCTTGNSVQMIQNTPTFLSNRGVQQIVATNVRDQRDTQYISNKVDTASDPALIGLMQEGGLSTAVSIDYDFKYILTVNGNCYVYDYRLNNWQKWNHINASVFFVRSDGYLYFGSRIDGLVYKFKKMNEPSAYTDDGTPINAYLKTKLFSFADDEHLKTVTKVWVSLRPSISSSSDISYISDRYQSPVMRKIADNIFDYSLWDYSNFSYLLNVYPQANAIKVHAKKIVYFQVILSNPRDLESMGILSIGMKVQGIRETK
ncbi:MAG TPA: hypothetical protein VK462_01660 [Nitrososphaeraceae archaeon]|nr:hypothetical protein [Nitrososphaeraceae archaeon]